MEHLRTKLCHKWSRNGQLDKTQQKPFVRCLSPLRIQSNTTSRSLTGCALENRSNSRTTPDSGRNHEGIETKTKYDYTRKIHSPPLTSLLQTKSLYCGPNFNRHNPKLPLIKYRLNLDWEKTATISKGSAKNNNMSCAPREFSRSGRNIKPFGIKMVPLRQRSNELFEGDVLKARSELKSLQTLRPLALTDFGGPDFGTELTIRGNVLQLSKRKEFQDGCMEADSCSILLEKESLGLRNGQSVHISTELMQWADAFAKPTVRRLNELVLSLAKPRLTGGKLRSRRMNCSTCFYHVQ